MTRTAHIDSDQWIIRAADQADAGALARCIDAAYERYRGRISDLPPVSDGIADEIRKNHVFVAVIAEEIVGGLILAEEADHLRLANIAVAPDHGGRGLGRALMEHAERECRDRGFSAMRLTTHVAMPENIRLYEHLGWKSAGGSGNKVQMVKHP